MTIRNSKVSRRVGLYAGLLSLLLASMSTGATGATTTTTTASGSTTTVPSSGATTTIPAGLSCAIQLVSKWPLTEVVNQTIVVSVNAANLGAMVPAATSGFGGLLLFGTDAPTTMAAVLTRVQARTPSKFPMLVMTDEEGGGVQRLTNIIGSIPWAHTMGKNLLAPRIRGLGARIGESLLTAGVNTDLAPVLDVDGRNVEPGALDPDGLRSFSGSPAIAAADGTAFMQGLADAGVTSVVKHFPGLGGASRNTDYGPATTKPWSVLKTTGLVPFEYAIAHGASAVMLSNASVPGLTALPSSLSSVVVQELRQNLGFRGLIMTDALSAGAISALHLDDAAASVKALVAGANMVLYGSASSPAASLALAHEISNSVVAAVTEGALSRATLNLDAAMVISTRNAVTC